MATRESETKGYNLDNIRTLLMRGFSSGELRRFCSDHPAFRPVSDQISGGASQAGIVDQLLAFARDKEQFDALLEWAEQDNPRRFVLHLPYYEGDTRQGQEETAYNLAQIRRLLTAAFTAQTLRRFCQDRPAFQSVANQLAPDAGLEDMIDRLLAFAKQRVLLGELLMEVQKENPRQYARFQPFVVDESEPPTEERSTRIRELLDKGRQALDDGRLEEALAGFTSAIELDPENAKAYALRGEGFRRLGRTEEALAELNRALELKPDDEWALACRGEAYRQMGRLDEALVDLNRALELEPDHGRALACRAATYRQLGRLEEALADLNYCLSLEPDYDWALANRGEVYRAMGRFEEALADLDRAVELKPDLAFALASRGETYRQMGRFGEAREDLSRAATLDPDDKWARAGLVQVQEELARLEASTRQAELTQRLEQLRRGVTGDELLREPFRIRIEALMSEAEDLTKAAKWEDASRQLEKAEALWQKWEAERQAWFDQDYYYRGLYEGLAESPVGPILAEEGRRRLEEVWEQAPDFDTAAALREALEEVNDDIGHRWLQGRLDQAEQRRAQLPEEQAQATASTGEALQERLLATRPSDREAWVGLWADLQRYESELQAALDAEAEAEAPEEEAPKLELEEAELEEPAAAKAEEPKPAPEPEPEPGYQRPPPKEPAREPQFWLVVARPDKTDWDAEFKSFAVDPQRRPIAWTGLHNSAPQVRLQRARQGDYVLAYYSARGRREITGFGEIVTDPYRLADGRSAVDIRPLYKFEHGVSWQTLKDEMPGLEKVRAAQMSFSEVTAEEYAKIRRLILERNAGAGLEELLPEPTSEEPARPFTPGVEPGPQVVSHIIWGGNQPPVPPPKEDRIRIHVTEKNVTLWHGDLDRPYKSLNHLDKYPELDQEETLTPREYGRLLFKGIIHEEGSRGFQRRPTSLGYYGAWEQARGKLRVELRVDPDLNAYMWEYLTDPRDDEPLAVSEEAPFYRLHGAADKDPVEAKPISILFVICNPTDLGSRPGHSGEPIPSLLGCLERLDSPLERKIIAEGMQDLVDKKLAVYDILEGTETGAVTLAAIKDQLRKKPYHILHLLAHGVYMRRRKEYALVMEAADRTHSFVCADDFDKALFDSDLRLIVLAACQSGRLDLGDALQTLAPILVERDVPAVIAMQRDLPLKAAQIFTRRFYGDLARTGRIDMAMAATRHDLYFRDRKSWSWGIPMLMTSTDTAQLFNLDQGRLFDVDDDRAERIPRPTFKDLEQELKDYAELDSEDPGLRKLARALESEIRAHGYGRDRAFLSTVRAAVAPHLATRPPEAEPIAPGQERESLLDLAPRVKMDAADLAEYVAGHSKLTLPPSTFGHIASTLNAGKHIILIGAHGTGKTSLAQDICAYAEQKRFAPGAVLTTATADWTTFDTVGGHVPTQDGTLQFRLGIFLEALRSGRWLVIDEINRAEIDKAFGELFTVLSGQEVELPYDVGGQGLRVLPPRPQPAGAEVDPGYWIPRPEPDVYHYVKHPNWRIIGTMNVYDKSSLFQLSFAFMRRFAFVDVDPPADEHYFYLVDDWLHKVGLPVVKPSGESQPVPFGDCKPIQRYFRQLLHRRPLPELAAGVPPAEAPGAARQPHEHVESAAFAAKPEPNPLMARRELGPAIIQDMIAYMGDRYQALDDKEVLKLMSDRYRALDAETRLLTLMGEAFLLYVVPHLDGLDYEGIKQVHAHVGRLFTDVDEERRQILHRIELLYPHIHDWDED